MASDIEVKSSLADSKAAFGWCGLFLLKVRPNGCQTFQLAIVN